MKGTLRYARWAGLLLSLASFGVSSETLTGRVVGVTATAIRSRCWMTSTPCTRSVLPATAYYLQVTLKSQARPLAPGLTPRAVLEKFAAIQMVDVHLPTTDGRHLILPRYTQPDADQQLLLQRLKLTLPQQPPPRIHRSGDLQNSAAKNSL